MDRYVTLICGPPCAGKSTLAQHLAKPGDFVLDLDVIARQLGSPTRWRHEPETQAHAEEMFLAALNRLARTDAVTAFVVRCLPNPWKRHKLARGIGAHRVMLIDPGKQTCLDSGPRRPPADRDADLDPRLVPGLRETPRRHHVPFAAPSECPVPGCGGIAGSCRRHPRGHRDRPHRPNTTSRGYDTRWQALVRSKKRHQRAQRGQAWCVDCGLTEQEALTTRNPLTGDHLRWPALTVDDVDITCRVCNSKRGARRSLAQ